jgi:transcription elongation GreA/GreB family factor
MPKPPIFLSRYEKRRLERLLGDSPPPNTCTGRALAELRTELDRACVLPPHVRLPLHVVTMGSRATVEDLDTGSVVQVTLTWPDDEPVDGSLSILDPLAIALIGARDGDRLSFEDGGATRRIRINHVVQPSLAEAAAALG